jgi:thioredoxin 1
MWISMGSVLDIEITEFKKKILESDKLTLTEFWHDRCPWCRVLEPILNEVAEKYKDKIRFTRFNILANPYNRELASRLGVMSTPTIVFYCQGKAIQSVAGFLTKVQLEKLMDYTLERYKQCAEQSTEFKQDFESFYA